jgi:HK97 family phage major capsid protein
MTLEQTNLFTDRRAHIGRQIQGMLNKPFAMGREELDRFEQFQQELRALEPMIARETRAKFERDYDRAFKNHLRFGYKAGVWGNGVSPEEQQILEKRDMGTSGQAAFPGSTSGFLASMEFSGFVTSALKYYGGVGSTASYFDRPSGVPLPFPSDNDCTSVGELVPEGQQMTARDVPIGQTILNAFRLDSSIIKISNELLKDAGFNIEEYLMKRLAVRLARTINYYHTQGSGAAQPLGLMNAATVGAIALGSSSNDGQSDGANTIGTGDLSALELSVDPAYRPGAAWMMHSNTLAWLRQLLDKNGRPIFANLHSGDQNRIFIYPVVMNDDMDQLQTGPSSPPVTRKTIAFGTFASYSIRRAPLWVFQMREKWAEYDQTGFGCVQRCDGNLIDGGGGAVKTLANVF